MKNIKFLAIAMTAMTVGLVSCNNENENGINPIDDVNKTVRISIASAELVESRAIGDPAKGQKTTVSTGQIIFTNASGEITKVYEINDSPTGGKNVHKNDIVSVGGVRFEGIKGSNVYVLVNKTVTAAVRANISTVQAASLGVTDLSEGSFENAILWGTSVLNYVSDKEYTATVQVAPLVSRIEIGEIKDVSVSADYTFDFDGLYINNFYKNMTVGGVVSDKQNYGTVEASYVSPYAGLVGSSTALNDTYTGVVDVNKYAPAGTPAKTWSYNIFPVKNIAPSDDLIPHIILRMKNLKKAGTLVFTPGEDYFITIRTYSGKTINEFKPGFAYKIASIGFDCSENGSTIPENDLINANVVVVVEAWGGMDITADVN